MSAKSVVRVSIIQSFEARKNVRNPSVLEQPGKVLNTILFDSKTEPWSIYVSALCNYIDWVYSHSIGTAMIALLIAAELGYGDKELWDIGLGAFLHDIGKLLIPKSIIQKPGPLSESETMHMRQHCELGADFLKSCNLSKDCMDIVLHHHERLDGSGYPKGLKGDEICRNARIAMLADVVDAITSYRPYKRPISMSAAINMLREDEAKYPQELLPVLERVLGDDRR